MTVQANTAAAFDEEFARVSAEMPEDAELKWDNAPMCVHFISSYREQVPESAKDVMHLRGEYHKCKECPLYEPPEDGRHHEGRCPLGLFGGIVHREHEMCEEQYKRLLEGED